MRDMANSTSDQHDLPRPKTRLARYRPWIQTAFLAIWLAPVQWLKGFPSCVFHCYACPLASLSCPVGIVAQFLAAGLVPLLALGVVIFVGALVGSLVCGWACPFGFLQDLAGLVPVRRLRIPNWMGYGRYLVIGVMVIGVPLYLHYSGGKPTDTPLFICRSCPAGAIESGLPYLAQQAKEGSYSSWSDVFYSDRGGMSQYKWVIMGLFAVASLVTYRPWCRVLCPLGGFLSLFNRFSILHLRYEAKACVGCNTCRSRCSMGVPVDKWVNQANCIRCMECTTCGAISPAFAGTKLDENPQTPPA